MVTLGEIKLKEFNNCNLVELSLFHVIRSYILNEVIKWQLSIFSSHTSQRN